MRHIHVLSVDKVPRDDEFKFRVRAKALVDKWHDILSASKASEGAVRKPATNGKPFAEDAGAANGKEGANGKEEFSPEAVEEKEESKESMDIDAKEEAAALAAEEKAENDALAEEETPVVPAAEESTADVTMSEAA